jgi:hypothetical protein
MQPTFLATLVAAALLLTAPLPSALAAGFECGFSNGKLKCEQTGGNGEAKQDEGMNESGERACPPGYVVLEKANKYGAFCEPREGLPPPAPTQVETCKFGMIGTPPNCDCPAGTDFQGYKGCVPVQVSNIGYQCESTVSPPTVGRSSYTMSPGTASSEAEAVGVFAQHLADNQWTATGPIVCKPVKYQ